MSEEVRRLCSAGATTIYLPRPEAAYENGASSPGGVQETRVQDKEFLLAHGYVEDEEEEGVFDLWVAVCDEDEEEDDEQDDGVFNLGLAACDDNSLAELPGSASLAAKPDGHKPIHLVRFSQGQPSFRSVSKQFSVKLEFKKSEPSADRYKYSRISSGLFEERVAFCVDTTIEKENALRVCQGLDDCTIKEQVIHMVLQVQPEVRRNGEQVHVKLSVAKLLIGVPRADFISSSREAMGYFPNFLAVRMEPAPAPASGGGWAAEAGRSFPVTYVSKDSGTTSTESVSRGDRDRYYEVGGNVTVGLPPAQVALQGRFGETWKPSGRVGDRGEVQAREGEVESSNAARFEWRMSAWGDRRKSAYRPDRPLKHGWLSPPSIPRLPFSPATGPTLTFRQDALWKFPQPPSHGNHVMPFLCRLTANLQLIKIIKGRLVACFDVAFEFENYIRVKL